MTKLERTMGIWGLLLLVGGLALAGFAWQSKKWGALLPGLLFLFFGSLLLKGALTRDAEKLERFNRRLEVGWRWLSFYLGFGIMIITVALFLGGSYAILRGQYFAGLVAIVLGLYAIRSGWHLIRYSFETLASFIAGTAHWVERNYRVLLVLAMFIIILLLMRIAGQR